MENLNITELKEDELSEIIGGSAGDFAYALGRVSVHLGAALLTGGATLGNSIGRAVHSLF